MNKTIDYIGLVNSKNKDYDKISKVLAKLRKIAHEKNIIIVTARELKYKHLGFFPDDSICDLH